MAPDMRCRAPRGGARGGLVRFLCALAAVGTGRGGRRAPRAASCRRRATQDVAGLDEVHVLRRERHRLPVEPAFEQERPAGVGRTLEASLQLRLEALDLLARQVAVARRVDDVAGGTRRVVEQRLLSCAPPARRSTWTRCCAGRSPGRRPPAGSQLLHGLKDARNSPNDLAMR